MNCLHERTNAFLSMLVEAVKVRCLAVKGKITWRCEQCGGPVCPKCGSVEATRLAPVWSANQINPPKRLARTGVP